MTVDSRFKPYRKMASQMMRPYIVGESTAGISVSDDDMPEDGGMIAIDPKNPRDQWYVSKDFFVKNYEEVTDA